MRAKTVRILRKYLLSNVADASEDKVKSDLRKLKKKYNKLNPNERANFKRKLVEMT